MVSWAVAQRSLTLGVGRTTARHSRSPSAFIARLRSGDTAFRAQGARRRLSYWPSMERQERRAATPCIHAAPTRAYIGRRYPLLLTAYDGTTAILARVISLKLCSRAVSPTKFRLPLGFLPPIPPALTLRLTEARAQRLVLANRVAELQRATEAARTALACLDASVPGHVAGHVPGHASGQGSVPAVGPPEGGTRGPAVLGGREQGAGGRGGGAR